MTKEMKKDLLESLFIRDNICDDEYSLALYYALADAEYHHEYTGDIVYYSTSGAIEIVNKMRQEECLSKISVPHTDLRNDRMIEEVRLDIRNIGWIFEQKEQMSKSKNFTVRDLKNWLDAFPNDTEVKIKLSDDASVNFDPLRHTTLFDSTNSKYLDSNDPLYNRRILEISIV